MHVKATYFFVCKTSQELQGILRNAGIIFSVLLYQVFFIHKKQMPFNFDVFDEVSMKSSGDFSKIVPVQ